MAEMANLANNVDAVDGRMIDVTDGGGDAVVEDRRLIEHVGPPLGNAARYKTDPGTVLMNFPTGLHPQSSFKLIWFDSRHDEK